MEPPNCIICLDTFSEINPLYLLPCGCKSAWLHLECEGNYLVHQQESILCPLCRRIIKLKTNYCFWPSAGNIQLVFCFILLGSLLELPYNYFIFIETHSILLLPFILNTTKTIDFFIAHIYFKQLTITGFILLEFIFSFNTHNIILMMSHTQFLLLIITHLLTVPGYSTKDPLEPFAISREIIHLKKIPL